MAKHSIFLSATAVAVVWNGRRYEMHIPKDDDAEIAPQALALLACAVRLMKGDEAFAEEMREWLIKEAPDSWIP